MNIEEKPQETPYEPPALVELGDVEVLTEGRVGPVTSDALFPHSLS